MSCPPYSTLVGLISACAGKIITPEETRIGYEFSRISECEELERTDRFVYDKGYLKEHPDGKYLVTRYVHFRPILDLYLTNLDFAKYFTKPAATPTLGRSQDLCWITKVEQVDLTPAESGRIGSTMIASDSIKLNRRISAELVSCVEYFDNQDMGMIRKVAAKRTFQVILPNPNGGTRKTIAANNLYHPSNLPTTEDVIYLHEWTSTAAN